MPLLPDLVLRSYDASFATVLGLRPGTRGWLRAVRRDTVRVSLDEVVKLVIAADLGVRLSRSFA
mgnify:CR=1 FL=1